MTGRRRLLSWLVLLVVAFLNGALRVVAYPTTLGDFAARQVACGVGAVLLGVAIWFLLRRWPIAAAREAWATGALWVVLTAVFEVVMTLVGGGTLDHALAQYAIGEGNLWPVLLLWLLVAPRAISAVQRSGTAAGAAILCGIASWLACGLVMLGTRALFGQEIALVVHLAAAPFVGAGAALLLQRHRRPPGVLGTAMAVAGIPALLDAIVVAPFLEGGFAMFESALGTWIPLALLLLAGATVARLRRRKLAPGAEIGASHEGATPRPEGSRGSRR